MWNNLGTAYEHLDQLDDARLAFEQGGKLGSKEAAASRKRLEGVDTIVVMRTDKEKPEKSDELVETTYDIAEPLPEGAVIDEATGEVKLVDEEVEVEESEIEDVDQVEEVDQAEDGDSPDAPETI